MTIPGCDTALADIHGTFAEQIIYTGAGLTTKILAAVVTDDAAASPDFGDGLRHKSFEIQLTALAAAGATSDPQKDDVIEDAAGDAWRVIEPVRRDDVGAWVLTVEVDD